MVDEKAWSEFAPLSLTEMVTGATDSSPEKLPTASGAAGADARPETPAPPAVIKWREEVMQLTKARLNMFVIFTTLLGFIYASQGAIDFLLMFHTIIGTAMVAGGSAALNQVMEVDQDRLMKRTRNRPLPSGRIGMVHAMSFGIGVSVIGLGYLFFSSGWLPMVLALATTVVYLLLYTPLKQTTVHNTLIGAISGAIPPVIGSAAVSGRVDLVGAFLFGILFFWQMPHFLAIAWMYREQYEQAGFRMWPMIDELGRSTSFQMLVYALCLLATSLVPVLLGWNNWIYGVIAVLSGGSMTAFALVFWRTKERVDARRLFFSTLFYLPILLVALVLTRR